MTLQAVTVGGIMVDNVVAGDGRVYRDRMGGNAVYAAAGARLWLERVGVVGLVPANYPRHWLDSLGAHGLATHGIRVLDEAVSLAEWFFYAADGSREDHLYGPFDAAPDLRDGDGLSVAGAAALRDRMKGGATAGRSAGDFRRAHPVTPDHLAPDHLAAPGFHLGPGRADQQCHMARHLADGLRCVTLDPGSNAREVACDLARAPARLHALLPSERELPAMAPGRGGLAGLRAFGAREAVVKLGAAGALVLPEGAAEPTRVPALPVEARDPTGAGDAFCGGFLAGLLRGADAVLAACCGTVAASFAVEAPGPFHLLGADRDEARRRLATLLARLPHGPRGALEPSGLSS